MSRRTAVSSMVNRRHPSDQDQDYDYMTLDRCHFTSPPPPPPSPPPPPPSTSPSLPVTPSSLVRVLLHVAMLRIPYNYPYWFSYCHESAFYNDPWHYRSPFISHHSFLTIHQSSFIFHHSSVMIYLTRGSIVESSQSRRNCLQR